MGRLLDTLLANMDSAARHAASSSPSSSNSQQCSSSDEIGGSGQQEPKLRLFSGHDSTLMPLLAGAWFSMGGGLGPRAVPCAVLRAGRTHPNLHVCCLSAPASPPAVLNADVERWPPYISSLVFELWELSPRQVQPSASMGPTSTTSSSDSDSSSPGAMVVRVLFNKQPLELPGATSGQ
jgi:hypothetical protein